MMGKERTAASDITYENATLIQEMFLFACTNLTKMVYIFSYID